MKYIDIDKLTEIVEEHSYELTDKDNSYGVGMFVGGIFQAMEEAEVDVEEVIHGNWDKPELNNYGKKDEP